MLPQLTPMRTGLSWRRAISIIVENCLSRFSRKPTFAGVDAILGQGLRTGPKVREQLVADIVEVTDQRYANALGFEQVADARHRRRRLRRSTVTRTNSDPARARAATCAAVARRRRYRFGHRLQRTTGALPPMVTPPTVTETLVPSLIGIHALGLFIKNRPASLRRPPPLIAASAPRRSTVSRRSFHWRHSDNCEPTASGSIDDGRPRPQPIGLQHHVSAHGPDLAMVGTGSPSTKISSPPALPVNRLRLG